MDCKISKETKTLVERYLDAANNLYGIVPLSKILLTMALTCAKMYQISKGVRQ